MGSPHPRPSANTRHSIRYPTCNALCGGRMSLHKCSTTSVSVWHHPAVILVSVIVVLLAQRLHHRVRREAFQVSELFVVCYAERPGERRRHRASLGPRRHRHGRRRDQQLRCVGFHPVDSPSAIVKTISDCTPASPRGGLHGVTWCAFLSLVGASPLVTLPPHVIRHGHGRHRRRRRRWSA